MGFPTQLVALNPGMPNRESLAASVSPAWGFPRKSLNIEETLTDKETPNRGIEYLPSSGNLHAGFPAKVVTLNPGEDMAGQFLLWPQALYQCRNHHERLLHCQLTNTLCTETLPAQGHE